MQEVFLADVEFNLSSPSYLSGIMKKLTKYQIFIIQKLQLLYSSLEHLLKYETPCICNRVINCNGVVG